MHDWHQYNEKLVRRGEILISDDCFKNWDKELAEMNRKKQGRRFLFPESFMKIVGYARAYFGLPYRQTEGLLRTYGTAIPKIHVGVDVNSKKIVSLKITDERSHDARHLPGLVEQASRSGIITKTLADAAYDSKNNFSFLYHNGIVPGIKVRRNSSGRSGGCHPGMVSVISQIGNLQYWKDSVSYRRRWIVESVFSVLKRISREHVMAHKRRNMVKELELKASLYNRFMSM